MQKILKYIKNVKKTETKAYIQIAEKSNAKTMRRLHGMIGIITEASELLDMMKKHIFYQKPFDSVNCVEEIGDLLYYIAILCDCESIDIFEAMQKNTAKLQARFGDKFTNESANNRNLENERNILEGKTWVSKPIKYDKNFRLLPNGVKIFYERHNPYITIYPNGIIRLYNEDDTFSLLNKKMEYITFDDNYKFLDVKLFDTNNDVLAQLLDERWIKIIVY